LDENRDIDIMIEGVGAMTWNIEVPLHMVVWSDGASRGNPGPGSCAACLGIMRPCEDLHRIEIGSAPLFFLCIDGKDYFCQTVACKGVRLGITTSNNSEFEAACLARRLIVDWLQRAQFLC
jgi:ribonuclease HI